MQGCVWLDKATKWELDSKHKAVTPLLLMARLPCWVTLKPGEFEKTKPPRKVQKQEGSLRPALCSIAYPEGALPMGLLVSKGISIVFFVLLCNQHHAMGIKQSAPVAAGLQYIKDARSPGDTVVLLPKGRPITAH